jgi:hypothetical protein
MYRHEHRFAGRQVALGLGRNDRSFVALVMNNIDFSRPIPGATNWLRKSGGQYDHVPGAPVDEMAPFANQAKHWRVREHVSRSEGVRPKILNIVHKKSSAQKAD